MRQKDLSVHEQLTRKKRKKHTTSAVQLYRAMPSPRLFRIHIRTRTSHVAPSCLPFHCRLRWVATHATCAKVAFSCPVPSARKTQNPLDPFVQRCKPPKHPRPTNRTNTHEQYCSVRQISEPAILAIHENGDSPAMFTAAVEGLPCERARRNLRGRVGNGAYVYVVQRACGICLWEPSDALETTRKTRLLEPRRDTKLSATRTRSRPAH